MQALQVNEFTHVDFNQTIDANGVNVTVSWWVIYHFIVFQFKKGIILAYQKTLFSSFQVVTIIFVRSDHGAELQYNWLMAMTN